jgi:orotate phosphoribosyltransferase
VSALAAALVEIGAIQFGQFAQPGAPGHFAPVAFNLRYLPSYPHILSSLAAALAPLVRTMPTTHLLAMPAALPLATALSLQAALPLVYAAPDDADAIEGAYDYNVPTALLTDVLDDGAAERVMIGRARRHGLEVAALLSVIDLGTARGLPCPTFIWRSADDLLTEISAPSEVMRRAALDWLAARR